MKQKKENGWREDLPKDAIDYESGGSLMREKNRRVEVARERVYYRCLDLLDDKYKHELKWNGIWFDLFTHVMVGERRQ